MGAFAFTGNGDHRRSRRSIQALGPPRLRARLVRVAREKAESQGPGENLRVEKQGAAREQIETWLGQKFDVRGENSMLKQTPSTIEGPGAFG